MFKNVHSKYVTLHSYKHKALELHLTQRPHFPASMSIPPSTTQTKEYIKLKEQASNHYSDWLILNHMIIFKSIAMSKWRKYPN